MSCEPRSLDARYSIVVLVMKSSKQRSQVRMLNFSVADTRLWHVGQCMRIELHDGQRLSASPGVRYMPDVFILHLVQRRISDLLLTPESDSCMYPLQPASRLCDPSFPSSNCIISSGLVTGM